MRSINSLIKWILFVPVCLMSVVIAVLNGLMPDTVPAFFATDQNGIAEIIAFSVLGLFLVCFGISLFDRKTSPVHLLKKNPYCGVAAVASALAMAACAAFELTQMINADSIEVVSVMTILFTAVSGVTMLYIGLNHFTGINTAKNISVLYLSLPLWCGVHLVDRFLKHTASPVAAADTLDLIMFVAMAMFFINVAMIHAVIPGKNAVKSAVNFGFPTVIVALVYGLSLIFAEVNSGSFNFINLLPAFVYVLISLYAIGFTVELSFRSKTTDEQIILEVEEESGAADEYYNDEESDEEYAEEIAADSDVQSDEEYADETEDSEEFFEEDAPAYVHENVPVAPAVVRIAQDTADSEDDLSADELYRVAQQKDRKNTEDIPQTYFTGSDDEVIIDGNPELNVPMVKGSGGSDDKPKGPTTREAIMYEDDDFILSVDSHDDKDPEFDEDEDISAFILEKQEMPEVEQQTNKTYEERMDEIDKLIISLQGDDEQTENV